MGADHLGWVDISATARGLGMEAVTVDSVMEKAEALSSTWIRQLVWSGEVALARDLLGRDYAITGLAAPGEGAGTRLGFPTANLETPSEKLLPKEGVYAGWVAGEALGPGALQVPVYGSAWPAAINLGTCPTVKGASRPTLEVHAIGWDGELYGAELTAGLVHRLRGEECFPSEEDLRVQIAADVERTLEVVAAAYGAGRAVGGHGEP